MKYEFRYYKPESIGKENLVENKDYISLMGCIDNHIWVRWLTNKRAAGKSSDECTYKELMKINTKTFNRILKRRGEVLEIVNKSNPSTYIKNEIETGSKSNCFQWVEVE